MSAYRATDPVNNACGAAVHVYKDLVLQQKVSDCQPTDAHYGHEVRVSQDGLALVIAASEATVSATGTAGTVFVHARATVDQQFSLVQTLTPPLPNVDGKFGQRIGMTVLVM